MKAILLQGLRYNWRGFGYITRKLYPSGIVAKNIWGATMALDPYEKIDSNILRSGTFDHHVTVALLEYLKPNDIFWDIGANVGLHSLSIKTKMNSIDCHCFEPFYKNFEKLVLNEKLNVSSHLNKYSFGLSETSSLFEIYTTKGNAGRSGFYPLANASQTSVKVLSISGNDLIEKHGMHIPNVMKLDTEGHELAVLKGCTTILRAASCRAIVYESFENQTAIEDLLNRFGFKCQPIGDGSNFLATR